MFRAASRLLTVLVAALLAPPAHATEWQQPPSEERQALMFAVLKAAVLDGAKQDLEVDLVV